eukprot:1148234-Pelagomonas_calceolata.AAC.5
MDTHELHQHPNDDPAAQEPMSMILRNCCMLHPHGSSLRLTLMPVGIPMPGGLPRGKDYKRQPELAQRYACEAGV